MPDQDKLKAVSNLMKKPRVCPILPQRLSIPTLTKFKFLTQEPFPQKSRINNQKKCFKMFRSITKSTASFNIATNTSDLSPSLPSSLKLTITLQLSFHHHRTIDKSESMKNYKKNLNSIKKN